MPNNRKAKQEREEFAALDAEAIRVKLDEEKKSLWQNRFSLGKRQLQNTAEIANARKRIARLMTYLHQRENTQEANS